MKVGVFDSGSGGLTILRSLVQVCPQYHYVYLGDHQNSPYGNLDFKTTLAYTQNAIDFLFNQGCQIIIIACNTASARVLRTIQQKHLPQFYSKDKRVLGVVRPATEELNQLKPQNLTAIWATSGTVKSKSYEIEVRQQSPQVNIISQSCDDLAKLIEKNDLSLIKQSIQNYWKQTLLKANGNTISTLLLACTHYPLVTDLIRECIGSSIHIIDQRELIKSKWENYLKRHQNIKTKLNLNSQINFLTTLKTPSFEIFLKNLFNGTSQLNYLNIQQVTL